MHRKIAFVGSIVVVSIIAAGCGSSTTDEAVSSQGEELVSMSRDVCIARGLIGSMVVSCPGRQAFPSPVPSYPPRSREPNNTCVCECNSTVTATRTCQGRQYTAQRTSSGSSVVFTACGSADTQNVANQACRNAKNVAKTLATMDLESATTNLDHHGLCSAISTGDITLPWPVCAPLLEQ